ncbi:hypothetical protein DC080_00575 [Ignatzschineria cameli]|nr:hypothetical protein DC080_00575 [Ignatzschineria cameli]
MNPFSLDEKGFFIILYFALSILVSIVEFRSHGAIYDMIISTAYYSICSTINRGDLIRPYVSFNSFIFSSIYQ